MSVPTKDWNTYADAVLDDTNTFDGKPHIYLPCLPKKTNKIPLRDLKAIRFIDMGARVKPMPQEKQNEHAVGSTAS